MAHSVFQICTFLKGTTIQWIDDQKVPYASKNNEWVGFDTRESYEIKVVFCTTDSRILHYIVLNLFYGLIHRSST